jgi:hypothetical protein
MTMPKAVDQTTPLAILPIWVERNPSNGNLFFCLSPGSRKRPLPRDPTTAEFNRAYHKCLLDAGEQHDLDDWSELEAMHRAQRLAKFRRMAIKGLALLLVQDRRACGERR